MLWTLVVILIIFWLLGFTIFSLGSLIHIVLVCAIILLAYAFLTGRRPAP